MSKTLRKHLAPAALAIITALSAITLPAPAAHAGSSVDVIDLSDLATASGTHWTYATGPYTSAHKYFTINGTDSDTVTITGANADSGEGQYVFIAVKGNANIILNDVTLSTYNAGAFMIDDGVTVNMALQGTNTVGTSSGADSAGIAVTKNSVLNITGPGILTAVGHCYDGGGAGIGGYFKSSAALPAGAINITGGTVIARGSNAAGIGGSGAAGFINPSKTNAGSDGGLVTISGNAVVHAFGTGGSAGIGGGGGSITAVPNIITVSYPGGSGGSAVITGNAIVMAESDGGAGIGGGGTGYNSSSSGNAVLPGGSGTISIGGSADVTATGGAISLNGDSYGGAGIGPGPSAKDPGAWGNVTITTKGKVTAKGGTGSKANGANIGTSAYGSNGGEEKITVPKAPAITSATPSTAPAITSVTPPTGQISINWAPGADGGALVTRYQYCCVAGAGAPAESDWKNIPNSYAGTTSCTIPDVPGGASYYVSVRAVNALGPGPGGTPPAPAVTLPIYRTLISAEQAGGADGKLATTGMKLTFDGPVEGLNSSTMIEMGGGASINGPITNAGSEDDGVYVVKLAGVPAGPENNGARTVTVKIKGLPPSYQLMNGAGNDTFTLTTYQPVPEPTPTAAINYEAETLDGLTNGTYKFNGGAEVAITNGAYALTNIPSPGSVNAVLSIVKLATGNHVDSSPQALSIPPRPAAPAPTPTNCAVLQNDDGGFKGVSPSMEYQKDGDAATDWAPISGNALTGLSPGKYLFRVKATPSSFKSLNGQAAVARYDGYPEPTPDIGINYLNEWLTGFGKNQDYIIDGVLYSPDSPDDGTKIYDEDEGDPGSDSHVPIKPEWLGRTGAQGLSIKKPGNGATTLTSEALSRDVPQRPPAPTGITTEANTIHGVDATMEYHSSGGALGAGESAMWTSGGAVIDSIYKGVYEIRVAALQNRIQIQEEYHGPNFVGAPLTVSVSGASISLDPFDPFVAGAAAEMQQNPVILTKGHGVEVENMEVGGDVPHFTVRGVYGDEDWTVEPNGDLAPGAYSATVTASMHIAGGSDPETPTAAAMATVLAPSSLEFAADWADWGRQALEGYAAPPEAHSFHIANSGSVDAENVDVAAEMTGSLAGKNPEDYFAVTGPDDKTITAHDTSGKWAIQPKQGLPAGVYTAKITASYDDGTGSGVRSAAERATDVAFVVNHKLELAEENPVSVNGSAGTENSTILTLRFKYPVTEDLTAGLISLSGAAVIDIDENAGRAMRVAEDGMSAALPIALPAKSLEGDPVEVTVAVPAGPDYAVQKGQQDALPPQTAGVHVRRAIDTGSGGPTAESPVPGRGTSYVQLTIDHQSLPLADVSMLGELNVPGAGTSIEGALIERIEHVDKDLGYTWRIYMKESGVSGPALVALPDSLGIAPFPVALKSGIAPERRYFLDPAGHNYLTDLPGAQQLDAYTDDGQAPPYVLHTSAEYSSPAYEGYAGQGAGGNGQSAGSGHASQGAGGNGQSAGAGHADPDAGGNGQGAGAGYPGQWRAADGQASAVAFITLDGKPMAQGSHAFADNGQATFNYDSGLHVTPIEDQLLISLLPGHMDTGSHKLIAVLNDGSYLLGQLYVSARPTVTTEALPDGITGEPYLQTIAAIGTQPITWSAAGGALPDGLELNPGSGAVTGVPTKDGAFAFTVQAANGLSQNTRQLSITVRTRPSITTDSLAGGVAGEAYLQTMEATGTAPITWSAIEGALPEGLELSPASGAITGTPATAGAFSFSIQAKNHVGSDAKPFTLIVAKPTAPPEPPPPPPPAPPSTGGGGSGGSGVTIPESPKNDGSLNLGGLQVLPPTGGGSWADGVGKGDDGKGSPIISQGGGIGGSSSGTGGTYGKGPGGGIIWPPPKNPDGSYDFPDGGRAIMPGNRGEVEFPGGTHITGSGEIHIGGSEGLIKLPNGVEIIAPPGTDITAGGHITLPGEAGGSVVLPGGITLPITKGGSLDIEPGAKLGYGPYFPDGRLFSDVGPGDWFQADAAFAYLMGLMEGTGENKFSPTAETTRAMAATVVWRMAGSPQPPETAAQGGTSNAGFLDVPPGGWHTKAVLWAHSAGIVKGVGENRYEPERNVDREELAAILHRYAQHMHITKPAAAPPTTFADAAEISWWARAATEWCAENGIIKGKPENKIDPQGEATRAEMAAMLKRFVETAGFLT